MKAVVGVLAETLLVCRQAIGRFLPMLCTVYVACILASGCASDGSLYSEMKKFRESEVRGRVNWLPIPGLAGQEFSASLLQRSTMMTVIPRHRRMIRGLCMLME